MNSVTNLLKKPFSAYSLDEKLEIKALGRPVPDLKLVNKQTVKNREVVRKFNRSVYAKHDWICGCEEKNAFYCFLCVLFEGGDAWTKHGVTDLVHLAAIIKKHESSVEHMNSVFSYKLLGKVNIQTQLSSHYRESVLKKNEEIAKNRLVFSKIINCIKFCGSFDLVRRSHNQRADSLNKGVFRELINFSADLDSVLKDHLEKSSVFKGTSRIIQNEILDCMLEVYHEEVKKEVVLADFVSVIADETTDITCKFPLVIILRYLKNGLPVERFWKFLLPDGQDSAALSTCILKELNILLNDPNKLISLSYDGAAVMSGVQKIIRDKYPYANFIHCYSHDANLIMTKASTNKNVKQFFSNLTGLCAFLSNSPQRMRILESVVQKRLPRACPTQWDFQSRCIHTVYENLTDLIKVMNIIQNSDAITLYSTIYQASAHERSLQDEKFVFWLTVFHKIIPHVDILFKQLQQKISNSVKIKDSISDFEKKIGNIRNEILDEDEQNQAGTSHDLQVKRRKRDEETFNARREAVEVCDSIISQIRDRFDFVGHLVAENLFVSEKFSEYAKSFPSEYLQETVNCYPFLNIIQLKTELQVLYMREELRKATGVVSLLRLFLEQDLDSVFTETTKLFKILMTIPMPSSEAERCFSVSKHVKTFLRNTMHRERLNALGMLSCEKLFVSGIDNFNDKVIDTFAARKNRRMDFIPHGL